MNRNLVGVGIVAAALAVLAGCSDGRSDRTADIGVGGEAASSYSTPSEMAPSAPFGTTQQIRSDGFAVGVSDYTVANPRREGDAFVVDLTIATKQGECIPGSFFVLTANGVKTEAQTSGPGRFDTSGTMIAGEVRTGTLTFTVPPGDTVSKFVLYHGTIDPPVAYWLAS